MDQSNQLGGEFERRVDEILLDLMLRYPKRVYFKRHSHFLLQSEEEIVPDFDLLVILPHERQFYAIECQARKRYSKGIVHKILYSRLGSWRQTYLFVYPDSIPDELKDAFEMSNVLHFPLAEFQAYIDNLGVVLEGLRTQAVEDDVDPAVVFAAHTAIKFRTPLSVELRDKPLSLLGDQGEFEREVLARAKSGYGQKDRGMLSDGKR